MKVIKAVFKPALLQRFALIYGSVTFLTTRMKPFFGHKIAYICFQKLSFPIYSQPRIKLYIFSSSIAPRIPEQTPPA